MVEAQSRHIHWHDSAHSSPHLSSSSLSSFLAQSPKLPPMVPPVGVLPPSLPREFPKVVDCRQEVAEIWNLHKDTRHKFKQVQAFRIA